jgi:HD-GYP domain-containing protein (c-di-GMP phosphodiesterase class II)
MSLKQLKVFIHELELGMFVSALDKPWAETPFPIQGFVMKTSADISRVKAYCDYVYVDIEKGVSPLDIETNLGSSNRSVKSDTMLSRTQTDGTPASINASRPNKTLSRKSLVINPNTYKKTVELAKEIPAARRAMNNLLGCLTVASRAMLREGAFDRSQLLHSVDDMVDSVIRCPDAFTWLLRLRSKDAHSHDHSVRSSLWATQFGRHIGLTVEQLKDLCLATLLKDVGRVKLDRALLHNPDRSPVQETEYRGFVSHSVELLRASGVDNRQVLNIIKYHCERFDGSGFPKGYAGNRIPFLAAIAGISSEFDRLCNPREAGETMAPSKATSRLYQMRGACFAENLVVEFIQSISLYPAGTIVELNTGDCGMVVEQNARTRLAPRLAIFDDKDGKVDQSKYIFVDLKNEQQARDRLQNFGKRRADVINKLAIVRDIEPASFGIEYSLLENLIARPFNSANAESLAIERRSSSPKGKGFLSAIKQRFAS